MINLEWYRIFLHTALNGNFTRAAHELHMTQPSVSYAIKQLEDALGITLFHRQSKGVELTEEGKALLQYVEQSFSLLADAEKHIIALKQLSKGEIRIGVSDSLIKHLLLPQLNKFHVEFPGIRIRLSHGKTPDITQRLITGQIDCAIVHMPVKDKQLKIQTLAILEDCFVVGEAYRELTNRSLATKELAEFPLLMLSPGSSTRIFVEQWFGTQGYIVKPDIELGSIDLLVEFTKLGYGAAFITRSFVKEELQAGKLFELRLDDPIPRRSIGFAVRQDIQLSLAADRFARLLLNQEEPNTTSEKL